jgi:hypothetical protein
MVESPTERIDYTTDSKELKYRFRGTECHEYPRKLWNDQCCRTGRLYIVRVKKNLESESETKGKKTSIRRMER